LAIVRHPSLHSEGCEGVKICKTKTARQGSHRGGFGGARIQEITLLGDNIF
jgi:hypothetical protein